MSAPCWNPQVESETNPDWLSLSCPVFLDGWLRAGCSAARLAVLGLIPSPPGPGLDTWNLERNVQIP